MVRITVVYRGKLLEKIIVKNPTKIHLLWLVVADGGYPRVVPLF